MDINRAKENLKGYLNWLKTNGFSMAKRDDEIQIILSELDKKDKIIDLMAEELADWYMDNRVDDRKIDKQYVINKFANFANKVEESEK